MAAASIRAGEELVGLRWISQQTDMNISQESAVVLVLQRRQIHAITTSYLLFSDPEENVTIPTLSSFSFSSSPSSSSC
ncbi:hypothetical protein EUGRSUZ_J01416 [Eucalyptus grandis]|uniref:Uncharacterized protein n=2 Tax=Eucalyptus grandis TaxID=71139 RepID=A0ACC3J615_EUCGR|nr:hypothetical protein EUGRSUZ_J01416 [Eucalyptus grandis]